MQISAEEIITRLKSALKLKTEAELAHLMNITASGLSTWKRRDSVDLDAVIALCQLYNVDLNPLFSAESGKMTTSEPLVPYAKSHTSGLPLIAVEAMAGYAKGSFPGELDSERYVIPEFTNKADFLVKVSGTSMSPKYFNGDIVACRKITTKSFLQWGKVYVMDTEQGFICKRVMPSEKKNHIICRSENSQLYPDFELPWSEVRALAIVVGSIRFE